MKRWIVANASFLRAFLAHLDTPVSLATWLLIENRQWDQLALRWVDPRDYPEGIFSALRYAKDAQAVDLLRKAPLPTSFDRREAAFAAWEKSETQCFLSNEFILSVDPPGGSSDPFRRQLSNYLTAVRNRLKRWLGPVPNSLQGRFGPGTCVEYEGQDPSVVDKLWLTPTTTSHCANVFEWHYSNTLWGASRWANRLGAPKTSRGNRLTTVPKDGKTDRPISIEPVGNLWLQLGIGRHLKSRLSSIGLPASSPASQEIFPGYVRTERDAQAIHRDFMFRCRRDRFSTIDLSSASDTVSFELVRRILPPDWFELLDCCRSPLTRVPSRVKGEQPRFRYLEKFSSMGNGFTFELETLVFASLLAVAFGLTPGVDLLVYGDDIILPSERFDSACNLLETLGFTVNTRKSYKEGPFFESCGANVHSDVDVTPLRITKALEAPDQIYAFHNAMVKRGFPRAVLRKLRNLIPKRLQFPGPSWLGDQVLHGLPYHVRSDHPRGLKGCLWVRALLAEPSVEIPLDRWSPEMAVVALLLGSGTRVVRRHGPVSYRSHLVSVS